MKTQTIIIILTAFFVVWFVGCSEEQTRAPTEVPPADTAVPKTAATETTTPLLDIPWDDRSIFRAGLIASEQDALDGLEGASVYHIDFQIADDFLSLEGWEEVHYTNREVEPLDAIYFQLFPNAVGGSVTVSQVTVDGQEVETTFKFEDTALRAALPSALQPGESVDIRLAFAVDIPQEMGGNYGLFGYFDEVLVLDEFYPVIPVFDDTGWNVQAPPPNADTSYFDVSFYLARVTAPANLTIAASGIEVNRESDGDRQIVTFAAGPMRDFYLVGSERYIVVSETVGETAVNSYALQGMEEGANAALSFSIDALNSFGSRFGPYPYTEYDVLSTPMLALGIEYPSIVGIAIPAFDPGEVVAGLPFPAILESVAAHEAAHQWFYNVIGNDQIDEPWLDEAHAQYATWLYFVDTYGEANAQGYRNSWNGRWQRVGGAEIPIGLPAYAYEGSEYSAIVYGRGPIFVEALAQEIGSETFDQFLRDYYETYQWGIATTESYRQLAEEQCNCDLSVLFEDWVYP
ncbi:MAG: M1 family metallopeptidase [Chloroflexi bacterium]|nr:M1 family metallopeptidase [Chloroflexota bacterium]